MSKSNLKQHKQEALKRHFKTKLLKHLDTKHHYTLHFRNWEDIPNALALPSGDIIITDALIALAKNQDEIDSVLLHEIAHVSHNHGMQMLIQGTFLTVATMLILGDTNAIADMGIGLGSLLVSSDYSRKFEVEADTYSFKQMLRSGVDPIAFSNIMGRIEASLNKDENNLTKSKNKNTPKGKNETFLDYFSSHPNTENRQEMAEKYSQCFKQNDKECLSLQSKSTNLY